MNQHGRLALLLGLRGGFIGGLVVILMPDGAPWWQWLLALMFSSWIATLTDSIAKENDE